MIARVMRAESLKHKRSLALRLAAVAPLVIVFLQFVLILDRGRSYLGENGDPWLSLVRPTMMFWALLMLPLFITLETALTAGLEHSGNSWKHLFVLPVPRGEIYLGKLAAGFGLIGLSHVWLVLFIILSAWGLNLFVPGLGFGWSPPWIALLGHAGLCFLSSWLLIAMHSWVALWWKNFVVSLGFGIAMTIAGVLVINSRWAKIYPWTLPALLLNGLKDGTLLRTPLVLSVVGGTVVAFAGAGLFLRRDVL